MKVASVIGITDEIVDETIAIQRAYKIKLPDAIIAATAINKKLILVTRNVADFKIIQELVLVNPWDKQFLLSITKFYPSNRIMALYL